MTIRVLLLVTLLPNVLLGRAVGHAHGDDLHQRPHWHMPDFLGQSHSDHDSESQHEDDAIYLSDDGSAVISAKLRVVADDAVAWSSAPAGGSAFDIHSTCPTLAYWSHPPPGLAAPPAPIYLRHLAILI